MKHTEFALALGIISGVLLIIAGLLVLALAEPPSSKTVGTNACWLEPMSGDAVESVCGDVGLAPETAFGFTGTGGR